ncbi:MAG: response regulator, partial [Elusimicrobia bacterium]|nr:response regulator [Elusimicrobiota bacterium]
MPPKIRLLLVEDDQSLSALLALELRRAGFEADVARSGEEAFQRLGATLYDAVITDLRLGGADGLAVLQESKRAQPEAEVLVITGHGSIDTAVAAMKHGAFDYLTKPVQPEELLLVLRKAIEHRSLLGEVRRLREEVKGKYSFEGIVYA